MAGYGDATEIKRQLELADADPDDAAKIARVAVLNESLSRNFDQKVNRTGTASETRTVQVGPHPGSFWFYPVAAWPSADDPAYPGAIALPWPVLTVSAIAEGGTWDGSAWDGETTLDAADYRLTGGDAAGGYYRIDRLLGPAWAGPVRITGTWLNAAWTNPPADVVEAVTFLVVHHYREDAMSPAGVVGPDGMQVPTRNPWAYGRVVEAIRRWRVYEVAV